MVRDIELTQNGQAISLQRDVEGEVIEIVDNIDWGAEPTKYSLDRDDLKVIPGSGGDPLIAIQNTPGAARIPLGLGGLVLRGSSPRDTAVFLDNVRVPLLYHFGGIRSFYQADLLKSVSVQASGYGSEFGRAQGGLVTVESDGHLEAKSWKVGGQISLTDSSIYAYGPLWNGGLSVGVRRSYIDLIVRPFVEDEVPLPIYRDGQIRWQKRGNQFSHVVNLFGSLDSNDSETFSFDNDFGRLLYRMTTRVRDYDIDATAHLGLDQVGINDKEEDRETLKHKSFVWGTRLAASRTYKNVKGQIGLDLEGRRFSYNFGDFEDEEPGAPIEAISAGTVWETNAAVYSRLAISLLNDSLTIEPGLRIDAFGLSEELTVDPRLSMRQDFSPSFAMKWAVGKYSQPPRPVDIANVGANPNIKSSHSIQSSFGVEFTQGSWLTLSAVAFASSLRNLPAYAISDDPTQNIGNPGRIVGQGAAFLELINDQFGYFGYLENVGSGRSRGLELFAKVDRETWFGWIAYTYSRSYRTDDPSQFPEERLYAFDQPHNLTAVASKKIGRWRLGTRIRWISGSPFTPVIGRVWDLEQARWISVDGDPFSDRLSSFISVDVRIDYSWKLKRGDLTLFLDLRNATNNANAEFKFYNNDFSREAEVNGIPIFPSFGLEFKPR